MCVLCVVFNLHYTHPIHICWATPTLDPLSSRAETMKYSNLCYYGEMVGGMEGAGKKGEEHVQSTCMFHFE